MLIHVLVAIGVCVAVVGFALAIIGNAKRNLRLITAGEKLLLLAITVLLVSVYAAITMNPREWGRVKFTRPIFIH